MWASLIQWYDAHQDAIFMVSATVLLLLQNRRVTDLEKRVLLYHRRELENEKRLESLEEWADEEPDATPAEPYVVVQVEPTKEWADLLSELRVMVKKEKETENHVG